MMCRLRLLSHSELATLRPRTLQTPLTMVIRYWTGLPLTPVYIIVSLCHELIRPGATPDYDIPRTLYSFNGGRQWRTESNEPSPQVPAKVEARVGGPAIGARAKVTSERGTAEFIGYEGVGYRGSFGFRSSPSRQTLYVIDTSILLHFC